MGKHPSFNCRQLERRLREIGCEHLRNTGSHRHYSNPFRPDRIITRVAILESLACFDFVKGGKHSIPQV